MSTTTTAINSINCVYGCNTRIYWNKSISEYWELLSKKKLICPKRSNNNKSVSTLPYNGTTTTIKSTNYNHKKSRPSKFSNKQPMDNSLEILQGPADTIRKQYEL